MRKEIKIHVGQMPDGKWYASTSDDHHSVADDPYTAVRLIANYLEMIDTGKLMPRPEREIV